MKVSDYIVEYLIEKNVKDIFGYPGGMVTHFMDSLSKYRDAITPHVMYHEQGAAFAACGNAQVNGNIGVAYATSGPGATNLITGICNAYFDSIPVLFITGQVNSFETKKDLPVRQRGFQETDIVSMVKGVTKYAVRIENENDIRLCLDRAVKFAMNGRKGPVLLDIPMNIFRAEIDKQLLAGDESEIDHIELEVSDAQKELLEEAIFNSKRPVILIGNGIKISGWEKETREILKELGIPVVSTMLAVDVMPSAEGNYGFIGAYGHRSANFIVAKSDLVLTLGARLDVRQVGAIRENFAPEARVIRVDIDADELAYKVHHDEDAIHADLKSILKVLKKISAYSETGWKQWRNVCDEISTQLDGIDTNAAEGFFEKIGKFISDDCIITTDVGQNQVWTAQFLKVKGTQKLLFSGGHGAMGYSLPAAIGAGCHTKGIVVSINGDGGFQMNLQELQVIVRERLPVKIVIFNNSSLGMIRHFQEMYFADNYTQTTQNAGYTVPDFGAIAKAYGIEYHRVEDERQVKEEWFKEKNACLIDVILPDKTYVFPKLEFGKPNQDQEPLLDRKLFDMLMAL